MMRYQTIRHDMSAAADNVEIVVGETFIEFREVPAEIEVRFNSTDSDPQPLSAPRDFDFDEQVGSIFITHDAAPGLELVIIAWDGLCDMSSATPAEIGVSLVDRLDSNLDSVTAVPPGVIGSEDNAADLQANIFNGNTDSTAVDLGGVKRIGIGFPAAMTGLNVALEGAADLAGPFFPLLDDAGAPLSFAVAVDSIVVVSTDIPTRFLRVVSDAAEAAARAIIIYAKL